MSPLSSDELREIREELTAGTTPTVWFTGSAVGVQEGRSGKVIALGEPAEGDFIQVRPAGSKDVLSFSVAEVTKVKPSRKRTTPPEPPAKPAAKPRAAAPAKPVAGQAKPSAPAKPRAAAASTPAPATASASAKPTGGAAARRKPRQAKPIGGATVTLTADQEGQWSVEVSTGKKRVVRSTPVAANAVAQAAKALHADVAAAVEPLIDAAREQQRARVEQLREELAAAQAALDELAN
ncbi:DUF6319 family protein [Saccharopolyspora phatthalungensis]|uniref:Cell wall anchor protein n=1 Tax=Saccharopolyspora phatthalungensis TaxID=664693 RepID=A0A840Q9A6_9PSEU|nr:DUF6319 family protein [Saccharopolyspora phatthalungensis]MBB5155258.1 hypothetical protein [Saccharopolyspora phatthalungensis]